MCYFKEIPVFQLAPLKNSDPISIAITKDYFGNKLKKDIYFSLSLDKVYLYFATRSELFSPPSAISYGFKEGLWENEVSELFIFNSLTNHYQEFNISPSGEFWGMNFSNYRERESQVDGLSYVVKDQTFILKIPLNTLKFDLNSNAILMHVAGVLRDQDGKEMLYSSCPIDNSKPDFHKRESGLKINII